VEITRPAFEVPSTCSSTRADHQAASLRGSWSRRLRRRARAAAHEDAGSDERGARPRRDRGAGIGSSEARSAYSKAAERSPAPGAHREAARARSAG
jgi:hypothetical protein